MLRGVDINNHFYLRGNGADCIIAPVDDVDVEVAQHGRCHVTNCAQVRLDGSSDDGLLM